MKYDFSGCLIDFTVVPDRVKLIDHFTELAAYPEFVNVLNDNEIKIAIAISDIESPFRKIKEPNMRLQALFEFLDIGLKNNRTKELYDDVLNYRHQRVNAACCRIIQMINNHDYAAWWTLNIAFYELQKESIKPRDVANNETTAKYVEAKSAIGTQMDKLAEKLKNYEARLFNDIKLKQAVVDQELKKMSFFPEQLAEQFPGFEKV